MLYLRQQNTEGVLCMKTPSYFVRRTQAVACAAIFTTVLLSGCGASAASSGAASSLAPGSAETAVQAAASACTVQVTSVSGSTVTAELGSLSAQTAPAGNGQGGGTPPAKPGESTEVADTAAAPDGSAGSDAGTPPAAPGKSDNSSASAAAGSTDGTPPALPGNGSGSDGQSGSTFTGSGQTITFTLTDSTAVTLEYLQGTGEGAVSDVAAGAVLEVTLDAQNQATAITVKNLKAGAGFGGSSEVTNGTAAATIDTDGTVSGTSYSSGGDDENALRVDGAAVTLTGITVNKEGGASSNTENGDFYGQNAGLLALNGATVTISDATVTTDAVNGNAVFSYGEGTTVNISDSTIRTTQNNSGGIQTTGGAVTNAADLDVETSGNSAAAIRSDRGGGTVKVDGGSYTTNGSGSPAIYSTADISVSNATLTANASEGVVVEGKNSVSLTNCTLTSTMSGTYKGDSEENIHGIMIYQSMSGDADVGEASFSATGGSIAAKTGDLLYITNTKCALSFSGVSFSRANDTFLRIEGNSSSRGWGTEGANGGTVAMTADAQTFDGNILVDSISSLSLSMKNGSAYTGAINPDGAAGTVDVAMDASSTWTLTADSYVSSFTGDTARVVANGYHLYVAGQAVI